MPSALPSRTDFRAALVMPDGRSFAAAAVPFQRDLFAAMDADPTRHVFVLTGRGWGKTLLAAMEAVAQLFLGAPGQRIYGVAVDQQQARLLLEAAAGLIRRTQGLAAAAVVEKNRIIVLDNALEIYSSDAPSALGLTPDLVIYDELLASGDGGWELFVSLFTALPKKGGRFIALTTAGPERYGWGYQMHERARTADSWLYVTTRETPPWISEEALEEQRAVLPASVFARFHGAEWVDTEDAFLSTGDVDAIFVGTVPDGGPRHAAIGVDLALTHDSAAAARVVMYGRGHYVVDELLTWRPPRGGRIDLDGVMRALPGLARGFSGPAYFMDAWQAALMAEQLRRDFGLLVQEVAFTRPLRDELFQELFRVIRAGRLKAPPHALFRAQLLGLRVTQTPGGWRVDHKRGGHDDIPVAVGLALVGFRQMMARTMPLMGLGADGKVTVADPFGPRNLSVQQLMRGGR